jgi:hypothetical protein
MSRATTWTQRQLRILVNEYPFADNTRVLAKKIGKSYKALKSKATVLKLHRQAHNSGFSNATKKELNYIRKNYLILPLKTIADHLGNGRTYTFVKGRMDAMGLVRPPELIQKIKDQFLIKPGNIPLNKGMKQKDYMSRAAIKRTIATRFKKGEPNHNSLYDGAITLRKDRIDKKGRYRAPHKYIRISKGVWQELQIYNWEQKKGKVPKGYVLACKDGNTLNCKISNWFLLTKADNAIRNAGHRNLPDTYVAHLIAGRKNKGLKPELLKYPELIELKRRTIILNRQLKKESHEKQKQRKHKRA